jgi:hypothetical protein
VGSGLLVGVSKMKPALMFILGIFGFHTFQTTMGLITLLKTQEMA